MVPVCFSVDLEVNRIERSNRCIFVCLRERSHHVKLHSGHSDSRHDRLTVSIQKQWICCNAKKCLDIKVSSLRQTSISHRSNAHASPNFAIHKRRSARYETFICIDAAAADTHIHTRSCDRLAATAFRTGTPMLSVVISIHRIVAKVFLLLRMRRRYVVVVGGSLTKLLIIVFTLQLCCMVWHGTRLPLHQ